MDNKVACPSCGKSVHKYSMNRHQEIHKGLTYDCTNCEKKFKTKYSLYDHSKTHKEVMHKELNTLENSLKNIPDKEKRYFTLIQKHENKIYSKKVLQPKVRTNMKHYN